MRRAPGTSRCPAPRDESSEILSWQGRVSHVVLGRFKEMKGVVLGGSQKAFPGGSRWLEVGGAPGPPHD